MKAPVVVSGVCTPLQTLSRNKQLTAAVCKSSDEKTWDDFHLEYQTASYGDQVDNDLEHTPDEDVDKEKDSFFDFSPRRDDNGYTL